MYKDFHYINAGTNEYYRWGKKARAKLESVLIPNENGFYTIVADGEKYWTFGTSEGKFGEYAKYKDTFFSVNKAGFLWAKAGTEKGDKFVQMIKDLLNQMEHDHRPVQNEED